MSVLPRVIRGILLGIPLVAFGVFSLCEPENQSNFFFYSKPEYRPFLEELAKIGQEKGRFASINGLTKSFWNESLSIGQLIALRADPAVWSEAEIRDLSQYIILKSREHGLSPYFVLSLIAVESNFRPTAVSPRGAIGLMQLMPDTAEEIAQRLGREWTGPQLLEDPKLNIEFGLYYVKHLKQRFGSPQYVLTAYNIGPAALEKKLKNGEDLPLGYYQKVIGELETYKRSSSSLSQRSHRVWL